MREAMSNRAILGEQERATGAVDLARYSGQLKDLMRPRAAFYWFDFVLCNIVGDAMVYVASTRASFSLSQIGCVVLAALALFRAGAFLHEITHWQKHLPGLALAYDLLYGCLHKLPLYSYRPHRYHHAPNTYGTKEDPEYEPLGKRPAVPTLIAPGIILISMPALALFRYGLVPALLPFIGKRGRNWVFARISTMAMNPRYVRPLPTPSEAKAWYLTDLGGFVYTGTCFALLFTGVVPWKVFYVWYVVMWLAYSLNHYRAVVSHAYLSNHSPSTFKEQILDTLTISPTVLDVWLFPLGVRYHTLHHMIASIPHHNLGKAHARLLEILPADHPYRRAVRPNYLDALRQLFRAQIANAAGNARPSMLPPSTIPPPV